MSTPPDLPDTLDLPGRPGASGPLAGPGTVTGGPIDDPVLADRNNPRWSEPSDAGMPTPGPDEPLIGGTPQDQAAQTLEGLLEEGTDNILEGRGDVQSNPALAEGGDNG